MSSNNDDILFLPDDTGASLPPVGKHYYMMDEDERDEAILQQMKKNFVARRDEVDESCMKFIERLRDAVLEHNANGEFVKLGISPAVLTDDFILRCLTFWNLQQNKSNQKVLVGYWFKERVAIKEGWLLATLSTLSEGATGAIEKGAETLPILTFPAKNAYDPFFVRLLNDIVDILKEYFPEVPKKPVRRSGLELSAALQKAQELRERGVYQPRTPVAVAVNRPAGIETAAKSQWQVARPVEKRNIFVPRLVLKAVLIAACLYFLQAWFRSRPTTALER